MLARLALRDMTRSPAATVVGVAAGIAGGVGWARDTRGPTFALGAVLMLVVSAALASGTHPRQRHDVYVLLVQGCPPARVRRAAWLAAATPVIAGAWSATIVVALTIDAGSRSGGVSGLLLWTAVLPTLGARSTAGIRLLGERAGFLTAKPLRAGRRLLVGLSLIVGGTLLTARATTGFDLDLTLPAAMIGATAGLWVLGPLFLKSGAILAGRSTRPGVRLAAAGVTGQQRALTLPLAVTATAMFILVVQSVLGTGLGQREQGRVDALKELGPATTALSSRQVVLRRVAAPGVLRSEVARAVPADAVVSGMDALPFVAHDAAIATPQLLNALGLDPALAHGTVAIVLDPRALNADGTVASSAITAGSAVMLPAQLARPRGVATALPAVLVPQRLLAPNPTEAPPMVEVSTVVVRFATTPSQRTVLALARATHAAANRGDHRVDLASEGRTDRVSSIRLRTNQDAAWLLATTGSLAVIGLAIAQFGVALAHRREDEVLNVLGARASTRAAIAGWRGFLIAAVGTTLGAGTGLSATAIGLAVYNRTGRFNAGNSLAPIQWSVPLVVIIGLVVVPLLSAAAGVAIAMLRRTSDQLSRAEHLAW